MIPYNEFWARTFVSGTEYEVWWKTMPSSFGNYAWGVTNMQTGQGGGGFSQDMTEAHQALIDYICEKEEVEAAVVPL